MAKTTGPSATFCFQDFLTSFVVLAENGVIEWYNSAAAGTLVGKNGRGRLFSEMLAEAAKFGTISKTAVGRIIAGIETGSTTFRLEDARTFLLHSHVSKSSIYVEWTDISSVFSDAGGRDPTTGLFTRREFLVVIDNLLAQNSARHFIFDLRLDNFKDVNELFGHAVGDHLLRRVSERISGQIRIAEARLAHVGGGEFLFVATEDEALPLTEVLLDLLSRPHLVDGKMVYPTVSMGVAIADGSNAETVLRNASLALKKARAEGGNQAVTFTTEMHEAMQRKRMLETELRKALAMRELSLVYQPQFRVKGRRLVGFEALLRWNHPDHGSISPAEFIPLAEELGLILPIGEWVLRTACRKAASWPPGISISVNISPLQFRSTTIVSSVKTALENSGLDPRRLDLEVTEGAILMNSAPIMETFWQLKAIGVRFSMDDFGTGYSSLSYLQKFPFDKIKIDQSFVRSLSANRDSLAIIRSVCALGKTLGLTTIAEGVETEEQMSQIEKKGCQQVQGYLTGRPLAPDVADRLVASSA